MFTQPATQLMELSEQHTAPCASLTDLGLLAELGCRPGVRRGAWPRVGPHRARATVRPGACGCSEGPFKAHCCLRGGATADG